MKKTIVFILMPLLAFMLCLGQIDEAATQEEETPDEVSTDTVLATAQFTIRSRSVHFFSRRQWRNWLKTIQFPGGQVIRAEVTWATSDRNGYVNDLEVLSNSTIKIHGRIRDRYVISNLLHATVRIEYLSEPSLLTEDVSGDGVVNIQDLVFVVNHFGPSIKKYRDHIALNKFTFIYEYSRADVNTDGVVNILDLVSVAGALGSDAAAPSVHPQLLEMLSASDVQKWLLQAQQLAPIDVPSQKGIAVLEQLLSVLTPQKTVLLPNYPNPFNPETWIPYRLAEAAEVMLTIYAIDGKIVRRLDLGHQVAGFYQSRSRAAYWDGRNALGEPVANGVYFYTLKAGDFSATKKMLIRK